MAKASGLGDRLYIGAYDLSGDVGSVRTVRGGGTPLEGTGISSSARERIAGLLDGEIAFNAFWNDAAGQAHPVLSALPTADVGVSYFKGHVLGAAAATMNAKQINYDPTRGADGSLIMAVQMLGRGASGNISLLWGNELTAGQRTDTSGTNPTSGIDDQGGAVVSTAFGATVWVHIIAFNGTNITFTLRDSADNSSFSAVTGGASSALTAIGYSQWSTGAAQAIRRYLSIGTSGTFTSCTFIVGVTRHLLATI